MADVRKLLERALDHYHESRFDEAERVLDRVDSIDPGNAEAMYLRGSVGFERREFGAALGFFDAAVAADPSDARFHTARAMLLGIAGRMEDAREALWTAIRIEADDADRVPDPDIGEYRILSAEVTMGSGPLPADPDSELSRTGGTLSAFLLAVGCNDEALETAVAAVETGDADADTCSLLAVLHEMREEYDLAERSARRAIELDPEQVDSMRILARVLRRGDRDGEAAEYERRVEALTAAGE